MRASVAGLILFVAAAGAAAIGGERGLRGQRAKGLENLGFRAYWSLLSEDQKAEAKVIIAEHLAATATDRLAAGSRLLRFRADVAGILTAEQKIEAVRVGWGLERLSKEGRIAMLDGLLDKTDRAGLADRVERISAAAGPEDRVAIGLEIHDQLYEVVEPALAERLGLTPDQRAEIRALYEELKVDLRPVALRLAEAKAAVTRRGLSILDDEQRAKLEKMKETVLGKVLGFLQG